jgi:hypothetical protein
VRERIAVFILLGAAMAAPVPTQAYGPQGHLIAGIAAERELCEDAAAAVAALGGGDGLPELGLWADRIRGEEAYRHTAPWHYMNIDDGGAVHDFRHPPEGDVLEAVERFTRVLADTSRPDAVRGEALRFLVHFVVDMHQPLHVGRAADRGGNRIELRVGRETTNLHRFWDSGAVEHANLSIARYARSLEPRVGAALDAGIALDPAVWAQESLALRDEVYAFDERQPRLDRGYLERAQGITHRRLGDAAARLAGTLNEIFCRAR